MTAKVLLQDKSSTGRGNSVPLGDATGFTQRRSIQASVEGAASVSAVVKVYGSNDSRYPVEVVTFTLSGSGFATDAVADDFPWESYVAEVVSLSTGARVSVIASI